MSSSSAWLVSIAVLSVFVRWTPCVADHLLGACSAPKPSGAKFSVQSHRNQTGHWSSKVQVLLGSGENSQIEKWTVDIEQRSVNCDGTTMLLIKAEITSPPPRAGPDYELFPGVGFYKFHKTPLTWEEGKRTCEREGAHLAIINSELESGVLKLLFSRNLDIQNATHNGVAGVGFHDQYVEGQYVTIFGEPLSSTGFTRWNPKQPDNAHSSATNPGEDCGSIFPEGTLNDIVCSYKIAFICEQEL